MVKMKLKTPKNLGEWLGWLVIIAILIGIVEQYTAFASPTWLPTLLVLVGIAIGFVSISKKESVGVMVAVLVLATVSGVFALVPVLADLYGAIANKVLAIAGPAVIVVGLRYLIGALRK